MKLKEFKKKVLGLIEELNPNNETLTDDPDIELKITEVINQILYELASYKRVPATADIEVKKGDLITFEDIEDESGYQVAKLDIVRGVDYVFRGHGTIIKVQEDGLLEVDFFRYPERITDKTKGNEELDATPDVLEVAVYGVAADLLKSDASANYGAIYANRYSEMRELIDPRGSTFTIEYDGGYNI